MVTMQSPGSSPPLGTSPVAETKVRTPGSGARRSSTDTEPSSNLIFELTRLRNELRQKEGSVEELMVEINTLKRTIVTKDRALEDAAGRLSEAQDQLSTLNGEAASLRKRLATAEAERAAAAADLAAASAEADKFSSKLLATSGATAQVVDGLSDDARRLQDQLAATQREVTRLEGEARVAAGDLRAQAAEVARLGAAAAQAEELLLAKRQLDNVIVDLRRQLRDREADISTHERLARLREEEVTDLGREGEGLRRELATTSEYLAGVMAELAAAQEALHGSRVEAKELRAELARAGADASRVAKGAGTGVAAGTASAMAGQLAEIRSLQSEVARLEVEAGRSGRAMKASIEQRERLYQRIDSLAAAAVAAASLNGAGAGGSNSLEMAETLRVAVALRSELAELREVDRLEGEEAVGEAGDSTPSATADEVARATESAAEGEAAPAETVAEADVVTGTPLAAAALPLALRARLVELLGEEAVEAEFGEAGAAGAAAEDLATAEAAPPAEAAVVEGAAEVVALRAELEATQAQLDAAHETALAEVVPAAAAATAAVAAAESKAAAAATDLEAAREELATLATTAATAVEAERVAALRQAVAEEELAATREQVSQLQVQLGELQRELEEAAAEEDDEDEDDEDDDEEGAEGPASAAWRQSSAAAEAERIRNRQVGWNGARIFGGTGEDPVAATGMTPSALADVLERLLAEREAAKRSGRGGQPDDEALYAQATTMLKSELSRLGQETVDGMAKAEALRSEVGELNTARLSAMATAARLQEMNELSMRVAALKLEAARREGLYAAREAELLAALDAARDGGGLPKEKKKKKRFSTKKIREKVSKAAKGLQKSLEEVTHSFNSRDEKQATLPVAEGGELEQPKKRSLFSNLSPRNWKPSSKEKQQQQQQPQA